MLRLAQRWRPRCTPIRAACTNSPAWPVAAFSVLARSVQRCGTSSSVTTATNALRSNWSVGGHVVSRGFASYDEEQYSDERDEPPEQEPVELPSDRVNPDDHGKSIISPGQKSKAERAAMKAKQRRQARQAAEEQKHNKARLEKAKAKARLAAAGAMQLGDVDAAVADDALELEVQARREAESLGLKEQTSDEVADAIARWTASGTPEQQQQSDATAAPDSEIGVSVAAGPVDPAVAAAAATKAAKAAAGKAAKAARMSPLQQAAAAAAQALKDLTANGAKPSPAALAAASKEANRLKALVDADAALIRVNEKITAAQLIMIGPDGKKIPGFFTRAEGLAKARELRLDLLQISPAHAPGPAACKLLDYKAHVADEAKKERDARRAKPVNREPKTIQLKSKIASGDLLVKVDRMRSFLARGHPVRLIYISKNPDPTIFFPMLQRCTEELLLDGHVEEGTLTPTKHFISFQPMNAKKRATVMSLLTPEQRTKYGVELDAHGQWAQKGRATEEEEAKKAEQMDAEEEEDEVDPEDDAKPAADVVAAVTPPKPAAIPAPPSGKKEKKHQKQKPAWMTAPPLFSKAALQAQAQDKQR